jgi:hypothetical protein
MLKRLVAEIMFMAPGDVNPGVAALIERDFHIELREDWIDPYGPAVFLRARATLDMSDGEFFHWVGTIVEPLGGYCDEAGYDYDDPPAPEGRGLHYVRGSLH